MKNNTLLDKASLYFFMSSIAVGLAMSIGFVLNLSIEESNQSAQLENLEKINITEIAKVESQPTIYILNEIAPDQINEFTSENITTFTTIEEVYPSFENQTDAILVVNKPIENLDANLNFTSFESVNNNIITYYYFHTKASSAVAKAHKYKLNPRKSIPEAKVIVG